MQFSCSPVTEARRGYDAGCIALPKSWDPHWVEIHVTHLDSLGSQIWDRRSRENKKRQDEAAAGDEDQPVRRQEAA